ncbi:MAG: response regulator [Alphaproteobacteria bacterium]|jgi:two-component system cell cycle response regulator CpdR|nr:response regulator [Alphaproteobacteria bacterium]
MARILLAEDDSAMRSFLAGALVKRGHVVRACEDGDTAFDALGEESGYDLLLADIVMPGMNGIELARRAVARHPELKTMFITGFAAVAVDAKPRLDFQVNIVSKPFHLREVIDRIDQILAA